VNEYVEDEDDQNSKTMVTNNEPFLLPSPFSLLLISLSAVGK